MADIIRGLDTVWVLMAAFLVFFMQAGFGMVEAGFIRAKNACNILTKNFLDFCMASLGFFVFGYAIMFGAGNAFAGVTGWFLVGAQSGADVPLYAFWLFQAAFCGAAATIVAGGMAERMKFPAYLIYSFIISAFIYPVVGHWIWGGGWLAQLGFFDFAGSTVVHSLGGFAALIGTVILGPRIGKYNSDGSANAIAGHSIPLASLGVFILWFGWFGFNPGSTLSVGNGDLIARVAINTNLAAAIGGLFAMMTVWKMFGKPDLSMAMNGALAGLVAITAPCAFVDPWAALIIGAVAGIVVVLGVVLLDKLHIDDPVGAVPVHGLNGIWGTLAIGLFGQKALGLGFDGFFLGGGLNQLWIQLLGVVSVVAFVVLAMGIVFKLIDATVGLRVTREDELRGLDIGEHGMEAYAGFQVFSNQ
ncbi:ammonium transporter [candidate division WOR-1 bacterium RIFOXYB2_FULL_42_35]|uniref:Ammonium transporter n=1 Tax=candidate division WOR-1 bacterium RIFOXYC2_FULL_41_25 TaxID=1802586 RepID=A0A1F4TRZ6_UNCSA|nr:MAG: ammonium transporter [candidate division WOR-1 bacterium RIFOXYA2_FULL_41_14]OGC25757.1 MAG: ammonium transporter [candidate division WOR-1 bacterium RIFOXYB2_FULL_42_35]OGC35359.1 MAG: ammonium transporter [candidate division WOR-1 bacterium RIFOXYC2_FULL_41_25]OGC43513.1 MAG: ammonium transporter [candidate division WOR-1 bacterium RIFOXYD2_FULL_41_8]